MKNIPAQNPWIGSYFFANKQGTLKMEQVRHAETNILFCASAGRHKRGPFLATRGKGLFAKAF